mmetsp:Transcript_26900/g.41234  ORF Transcript_26900/g.41234 Transcript_26900/m.41234 type:complete len:152 (-) Transcript_26900:578-1033(-)
MLPMKGTAAWYSVICVVSVHSSENSMASIPSDEVAVATRGRPGEIEYSLLVRKTTPSQSLASHAVVGDRVGSSVGAVGLDDGTALGVADGIEDGATVGEADGNAVGEGDGIELGSSEGDCDGTTEGASDGECDGTIEGVLEGDGDGTAEGV